jgi:hypothetical protein
MEKEKKRAYLKKLGWAGIIFFTVKGIISTGLILGLMRFGCN